jgi:hypothetical protein
MLFVSTEEFTATAATVTECYFKVTVHSFGGILRDERLSMVFFECRDLSMLRNQFFLDLFRLNPKQTRSKLP